MDYVDRVEALVGKYEPRILAVLGNVREVFVGGGWTLLGKPYHMLDEEHSWWVTFLPPGAAPGEVRDDAVDVRFEVNEQCVHDADGEGVTFRVDVTRYGGAVLGELSPGNYTEECWLSLDDPGAIEERFKIFERADPGEVVALVRRGA